MTYPPRKAAIDTIRARLADNHPGDVSFGHEDIEILLRAIDYQDSIIKGHQEDMRDAGRELREMERELGQAQRAAEEARGGW